MNSVACSFVAACALFAPAVYSLGADDAHDNTGERSDNRMHEEVAGSNATDWLSYFPEYSKLELYDPTGGWSYYYMSASDDGGLGDVRDSESTYTFASKSAASAPVFHFQWMPREGGFLIKVHSNPDNGVAEGRYLTAHDWYSGDKYGQHVRTILHSDRNKAAIWAPYPLRYRTITLQLSKNYASSGQSAVGQFLWAPSKWSTAERDSRSFYLPLTDDSDEAAIAIYPHGPGS